MFRLLLLFSFYSKRTKQCKNCYMHLIFTFIIIIVVVVVVTAAVIVVDIFSLLRVFHTSVLLFNH